MDEAVAHSVIVPCCSLQRGRNPGSGLVASMDRRWGVADDREAQILNSDFQYA